MTEKIFFAIADSDEPVSGEKLGEIFGISRTAVNKHINKLRDSGVNIEAGRKGYKYIDDDALTEYTVKYKLYKENLDLGVYISVVDSTNNEAKKLLSCNKNDFVVIAPYQTLGRGRMTRQFVSEKGGLYQSYVYHPKSLSISDSLNLVLLTGLAVSRILGKLGVASDIKWPNDVFVNDRKICGILLESTLNEAKVDSVIIGVGINVYNDIKGDLADVATSIKEYGVNTDRETVLCMLLKELKDMVNVYENNGFAPFENEYYNKSRTMNRIVTVNNNGEKITGLAIGLTKEGYLRLKINDKETTVIVGDVEV